MRYIKLLLGVGGKVEKVVEGPVEVMEEDQEWEAGVTGMVMVMMLTLRS